MRHPLMPLRVWPLLPLLPRGGVMARSCRVLPAGWRAPRRAGRAAVPGSPPGCRRGGGAGPGRSLSRWPPRLRRLPGRVSSTSASAEATTVPGVRIGLDEALEVTRAGDVWLFRGHTAAGRAIQLTTNSPVSHVGMSVVLDDLPALMWHAELGRPLPDLWPGGRHRGAQLHDLRAAVTLWAARYGQRAWLRQLEPPAGRAMDDARSEEHTSELQSQFHLVCRLLLEKKKEQITRKPYNDKVQEVNIFR